MADETPKPGETPAPAQEAEDKENKDGKSPDSAEKGDDFDRERALETIRKLREIEKQHKQDKRELDRLKEAEAKRNEAEMTELEKAQKRSAELEAELQRERGEKTRLKVAAKHQLPDALAARLRGDTEEELDADAQELAKLLPKKKDPVLSPNDIGDGRKGETDEQKRARIYNKGVDMFDVEAIKSKGGGVFFNQQ